jgi:hypothetical protein
MPAIASRSGPLFDGRASAAAYLWTKDIEDHVSQDIVNRIHRRLKTVLQNPTGYYESMIHTEKHLDDVVVTDDPVVYGPWLEGVGSRNYPVTRFKGYGTFRLVARQMDRQMGMVAETRLIAGGYLRAMNE